LKGYRERVYIIKDILILLGNVGELSLTNLLSYCGLNYLKHKSLIDELEEKGLIEKRVEERGKRKVTVYRITNRGLRFCYKVLEPYEEMFPRKGRRMVNFVT